VRFLDPAIDVYMGEMVDTGLVRRETTGAINEDFEKALLLCCFSFFLRLP